MVIGQADFIGEQADFKADRRIGGFVFRLDGKKYLNFLFLFYFLYKFHKIENEIRLSAFHCINTYKIYILRA